VDGNYTEKHTEVSAMPPQSAMIFGRQTMNQVLSLQQNQLTLAFIE